MLNDNTWNYLTVCKQMINIKQNISVGNSSKCLTVYKQIRSGSF